MVSLTLFSYGVFSDEHATAGYCTGNRPIAFDWLLRAGGKRLVLDQALALPASVGRQEEGVHVPCDRLSEELIPQEPRHGAALVAQLGDFRTEEVLAGNQAGSDTVELEEGLRQVFAPNEAVQDTEPSVEPQELGEPENGWRIHQPRSARFLDAQAEFRDKGDWDPSAGIGPNPFGTGSGGFGTRV